MLKTVTMTWRTTNGTVTSEEEWCESCIGHLLDPEIHICDDIDECECEGTHIETQPMIQWGVVDDYTERL